MRRLGSSTFVGVYPGGKNSDGIFQRIINQFPPHDVFIEPFLGSGAILRLKRPAAVNYGMDLSPRAIRQFLKLLPSSQLASGSTARILRPRLADTLPGGIVITDATLSRLAKSGGASDRLPSSLKTAMQPAASSKMASGSAIVKSGGASSSTSSLKLARVASAAALANFGDGRTSSLLAVVDVDAPGPFIAGRGLMQFSSADIAVSGDMRSRTRVFVANALDFLERYEFSGSELVYCDPPYLWQTRSGTERYDFEMSDLQHQRLLSILRGLPCRVVLSGYPSQLYRSKLRTWRRIDYQAMTRGGATTECLWLNFPESTELHQYNYLGDCFRERERIKRKRLRWVERLRRMPLLERRSLLSAIAEVK